MKKEQPSLAVSRRLSRSIQGFWLLGAMLSLPAGCEDRQVAVISVDNRPAGSTSLGVYYALDNGPLKSAAVTDNLDQFGIELPIDTTGQLQTQVFAYQNGVPCSVANGSGSIDMPGKYRQNLDLPLTPTSSRCVAATEPVDFPTQKMAIFALAANDIWLAGDGGRILHWNGSYYTKIPLPSDLAADPPNWSAVWARNSDDVWVVGNKSVVAHFNKGVLRRSDVLGSGNQPDYPATDWLAIAPGDPAVGDVWLAGTLGVFGYIGKGATEVSKAQFTCIAPPPPAQGVNGIPMGSITEDLNAVACLSITNSYKCYWVGNNGTIARYYAHQEANSTYTSCLKFTSPTTTNLTGVWLGASQAADRYEVRIVGSGGYALRGIISLSQVLSSDADPAFQTTGFDYSSFVPAGSNVDFLAMSGTALDDVWLSGKSGVLLKWENTAHPPGTATVFTPKQTGLTAALSGLSSIGNGVFVSGANKTLSYYGPLFMPQ